MSETRDRRRRQEDPAPPDNSQGFTGLNIDARHVQKALDYLQASAAQVEEAKALERKYKLEAEAWFDDAFATSTAKGTEARKVDARRNRRYLHFRELAAQQAAALAGFHAQRSAYEHLISAWQTACRTASGTRL